MRDYKIEIGDGENHIYWLHSDNKLEYEKTMQNSVDEHREFLDLIVNCINYMRRNGLIDFEITKL